MKSAGGKQVTSQDKFDKLFTAMKSKQEITENLSDDKSLHDRLIASNVSFNEAIQKAWKATQEKGPFEGLRALEQGNAETVMLQIMTHLNNQPQNKDSDAHTNWALKLNALAEKLPDKPAYKNLVVTLRLAVKFVITAVTVAALGFSLPFVLIAAAPTMGLSIWISVGLFMAGSSALEAVDLNRLKRNMGTEMHGFKQQLMDLKKSPSEEKNTPNSNTEASSKNSSPG